MYGFQLSRWRSVECVGSSSAGGGVWSVRVPAQPVEECGVYGFQLSRWRSVECTGSSSACGGVWSVRVPAQPVEECGVYGFQLSRSRSVKCTGSSSAGGGVWSVRVPAQPVEECEVECGRGTVSSVTAVAEAGCRPVWTDTARQLQVANVFPSESRAAWQC